MTFSRFVTHVYHLQVAQLRDCTKTCMRADLDIYNMQINQKNTSGKKKVQPEDNSSMASAHDVKAEVFFLYFLPGRSLLLIY
jgi:hypothetical protein